MSVLNVELGLSGEPDDSFDLRVSGLGSGLSMVPVFSVSVSESFHSLTTVASQAWGSSINATLEEALAAWPLEPLGLLESLLLWFLKPLPPCCLLRL